MTSMKALPLDKSALLELVTDGPQGTIVGRFSVFGVIDAMGDRTMPGCFDKAISHLERNGMKLPLLYHHQTTKGEAVIGVCDKLWTTKDGAYFRARLDMSNPLAQRLYAIMSIEPTAMGVSMGFGMPPAHRGERKAKDGAMDLIEVFPLIEISLTTMPALDVARVEAVKSHGRASTKVENLLIQLDAAAARGGYESLDPVYVFEGLVNDPVFAWKALEAQIAVKAAKDVGGLGATRCRCGKYITNTVQPPVSGGSVAWQACESCGSIRSFIPKSMSDRDADREYRNIRAKVRTVREADRSGDAARNAKMIRDLEKSRQRQEIADLVDFVKTPARPSKSDTQREIASFTDVLKKKKPSSDPVENFDALFGAAPPIPKEKLR